jgi:hypothetical protein
MPSGRAEYIVTISRRMLCQDNTTTARAEVVVHDAPTTFAIFGRRGSRYVSPSLKRPAFQVA